MSPRAQPAGVVAAPVAAIQRCRVCGGRGFELVLDLHEQVIGSPLQRAGEPDAPRAPLRLVRCGDCSMVQLGHVLDGDLLRHAPWQPAASGRARRAHLAGLAEQAQRVGRLAAGDVAIDIGRDAGAVLRCYPAGVRRVAVDSGGSPPICDEHVAERFSREAVRGALDGRRAAVITTREAFCERNDPSAFAEEVRQCLADDGLWVLEVGYLPAVLRANAYDSICHQHSGYYRIKTFEEALAGVDLEVFDVETNDCSGGSLRLFVAPRGRRRKTERYVWVKIDESRQLLDTPIPYQAFARRVRRARAELHAFLAGARRRAETVYGYGVSTAGMVALHYCGITPEQVPAVVDSNPRHRGMVCPGTGIPVCTEADVRAARPAYLLVLAWHQLDEAVQRLQDYTRGGGQLLVALPEVAVRGAGGGAGS